MAPLGDDRNRICATFFSRRQATAGAHRRAFVEVEAAAGIERRQRGDTVGRRHDPAVDRLDHRDRRQRVGR